MSGSDIEEIDVAGDAVNVSARLSDAAPSGCIYVGPAVEDETGGDFDYRALPLLKLKGKAEQFRAFELLSTTELRHRARDGGDTPVQRFVGRAAPMAAIDEALATVAAGSGQIVSLIGDAGIGKSRLLAELRSRNREKPFAWLEGRSLAVGQNLAFHPFADLLRSWPGIDGEAMERLGTSLEQNSKNKAAL